jgi:CRP-like cAMP-binding protein
MDRLVFMPGDRITNEGEMEPHMYILLKGSVQVVKNANEDVPIIIATMHRDCVFGEQGLLGCKRTASVVAMTYCDALRLHDEAFMRIMKRQPALGVILGSLRRAIVRGDELEPHVPVSEMLSNLKQETSLGSVAARVIRREGGIEMPPTPTNPMRRMSTAAVNAKRRVSTFKQTLTQKTVEMSGGNKSNHANQTMIETKKHHQLEKPAHSPIAKQESQSPKPAQVQQTVPEVTSSDLVLPPPQIQPNIPTAAVLKSPNQQAEPEKKSNGISPKLDPIVMKTLPVIQQSYDGSNSKSVDTVPSTEKERLYAKYLG